jgi:PIN domain nuclease of toxin-antitoxin system
MGQPLVILVDTHVVLWLTSDPARLSGKASAAIEVSRKNGDGLAICDITLLELTTLASKGRIGLGISLESFLQEVETRFVVFPITSRACARAMGFPPTFPKDPADRMIVATALVEGLPLITADREIRRSKLIPTIW